MLAQIQPSYITTYFQRNTSQYTVATYFNNLLGVSSHKSVVKRKNKESFTLSDQSKRKLKKSIIQLCYLAKPRHVVTNTGKTIFNFRAAMFTLTLPSPQTHSDIKLKKLLGTLIQSFRNKELKNYVWKAELQKNGNIHFHLCTDIFIPAGEVQRHWNRILEKHGMLSVYRNKFRGMSLTEYAAKRNLKKELAAKAFERNVKNNWSDPPTVNATAIKNTNDLSKYLSKYLAKDCSGQESNNGDKDRAAAFGKFWSQSTSLSQINYLPVEYSEIETEVKTITAAKNTKIINQDYYTVILFEEKELPYKTRNWLREFINNRAESSGYFN